MDHDDLQRLHITEEDEGSVRRITQWCQQPMSTRLLGLLICLCAGLIILNIIITASSRDAHEKEMETIFTSHKAQAGDLLKTLLSMLHNRTRDFPLYNDTYDTACPDDWTPFQESCYYFSNLARSWKEAKKMCERKRSRLVVINTKTEQIFVAQLAMKIRAWIGLTDVDGDWKWVDGTPFSSTPKKWATGQPDEYFGHGLGGGEDCAQLYYNGDWNDEHCSRAYRYICEVKAQ